MVTLTKHRLLLVPLVALVLLLTWYGLAGDVMGQEEPEVPGCPERERCVSVRDWPPFTAIFKAYADSSISVDGAQYRPLVTYRLEWRRINDWEATVIDAERFDFGYNVFDLTGSYERFRDNTYTTYDATTGDEPRVTTYPAGNYHFPPGGPAFWPPTYVGLDLATRTDGEAVPVDADVCVGATCHEVQSSASRATAATIGRRFSDESLADHTFTDVFGRIPLKVDRTGQGMLEVLELQVHPTEPNPAACQTNLREVFVSADLDAQQWDEDCTSTHRTGAFSHYYTFEVGEEQMVTIEAESPTVDLYLYLLEGVAKGGRIIAENDTLSGSGSSGQTRSDGGSSHASGLERRLSAGTYTAEITTNQIGMQDGTFSLSVLSPVPAPTPITAPTPTPTPTPTATPTATPTPEPVTYNGNPRAESVMRTSVTVSWDRLGSLPRPGSATDYRVNYRLSASESWMFGNYVTSESFGNRRPQTTVPPSGALRCNTAYEFQVEVKVLGRGSGWHDYGTSPPGRRVAETRRACPAVYA